MTFLEAAENVLKQSGICHIVARPVGANWCGRSRHSPCGSAIPSAFGLGPRKLGGYDPPRQSESDFTNRPDGADVICGAPDDLTYELEPMLKMENEMEGDYGPAAAR